MPPDEWTLARNDQKYGENQDVDLVILAARHVGRTLFPITEWPAYVHVARPLVAHPEERNDLQSDELHLIGCAEIYRTEEDARGKCRRTKRSFRWSLVAVAFVLGLVLTARVCLTEFEGVRGVILVCTALPLGAFVLLLIIRQKE